MDTKLVTAIQIPRKPNKHIIDVFDNGTMICMVLDQPLPDSATLVIDRAFPFKIQRLGQRGFGDKNGLPVKGETIALPRAVSSEALGDLEDILNDLIDDPSTAHRRRK